MKKLIMAVAMTAVMAVSASAFAADYDPGAGATTASNEERSYRTVLITKKDDANAIVYVNQNDTGLGAAAKFLIKEGAEAGEYVLKMGGSDAELWTEYFTITPDNVQGKKELVPAGEDHTEVDGKELYRMGFVLGSTVEIQNYKSIAVSYTDNGTTSTLLYPLNLIPGLDQMSGNTKLGIQITDIPEANKDNFAVSLSTQEAASTGESAGE